MKKVILAAMCLLCLTVSAQDPATAWETLYPAIEKQIKAPEFRDKDYNILDYGRQNKRADYLYTELINTTIERCSAEGGGRVIIPAGVWMTGPITLKSNVNLYLAEGAITISP